MTGPRPLPAFARACVRGSIALGDSYANRSWDVADVVGLLRRLLRLSRPLRYLDSFRANVAEPFRRRGHDQPSHEVDRANIAYHYDLPPKWFALFLDRSLSYSCAIYTGPDCTLDEGAAHKIQRVCEMLDLNEQSHLLDIGFGWGALTLTAAQRYSARVTATTLSEGQWAYLIDTVERASVEGRVCVLCQHYEELTGTFDAIASIEMIEAIDWRRQLEFLAACRRLLAPGGRFVLQAITVSDTHHNRVKRHEDFVKRFIFPGGSLPSRRSLERDFETAGLEVVDAIPIGEHYARTLGDWRRNLEANRDAALSMGMSDRFVRLWSFYLAYCEAGFRERYLDDYQFLLRPCS